MNFFTPTVVGDLLFIGSCAGNFNAFDRQTGEERWRYDVSQDGAKSFHGSMLVVEDLILAGTDGPRDGYLYAFKMITGDLVWKYHAGLGISTDLLKKEDKIYGIRRTETGGDLVCLNLKNGTEIWNTQIDAAVGPPFVINKSPAMEGDRIFYGGADGFLYAFNSESGAVEWKQNFETAIKTPITIHDNGLYFGTEFGQIFRVNVETGKPEQQMEVDGMPHGPITLLGDKWVFFVNWMKPESALIEVDFGLKDIIWQRQPRDTGYWISARPFELNGKVLAGGNLGHIHALDLDTGELHWTHNLQGEAPRSFGNYQDWLYVGTIDGLLFALKR